MKPRIWSNQRKIVTTNVSADLLDADGSPQSLDIGHLIAACHHERSVKELYRVQSLIGAGGFGQVWEVEHRLTGMAEIVKRIPKSNDVQGAEFVVTEIQSLLRLDHPHVGRISQWFETDTSVDIVMEHVRGQDLGGYIGHSDARLLFYQLMKAVTYCHAKNVVHRDLKMENCLVGESGEKVLKLIDFGLAAEWRPSDPWMTCRCGTVYYMSPNIICGLPYSSKCDVWAAGVILYILFANEHPFYDDVVSVESLRDEECVFTNILQRTLKEKPLGRSRAARAQRALIRQMLNKDASVRPTAAQVLQICQRNQSVNSPATQFDLSTALARAAIFSHYSNAFERAILRIVARLMDDDDLCNLRKAFEHVNSSGDGSISREEMIAAFSSAGFCGSVANTMLQVVDGAVPGQIEYTEWLIATMSSKLISSEKAVLRAFHFLDSRGCSMLNKRDLERAFGKGVAEQMLHRWDSTKGGSLNLDDFQHILTHIASRRARLAETSAWQSCTGQGQHFLRFCEAAKCGAQEGSSDGNVQATSPGMQEAAPARSNPALLPRLLGRTEQEASSKSRILLSQKLSRSLLSEKLSEILPA